MVSVSMVTVSMVILNENFAKVVTSYGVVSNKDTEVLSAVKSSSTH